MKCFRLASAVAGAFMAWRDWTLARVKHKDLLRRALHMIMHRHLHAAFETWHSGSARKAAQREVMDRAVKHMMNASLVSL